MTLDRLLKIPKQELAKNTLKIYHENERLKSELIELKRMIFGQKSERFISENNPDQQNLFFEESTVAIEEKISVTYEKSKSGKKPGHGRKELPAHLPRVDHIIEPDEDVSGLVKIGEEHTEELEYKPAELYVNRYIRPKYAHKDGEGIVIGLLPNRPIEKGIPGPGLLSHILISKYVDHLPLYRQRQIFKRNSMDIAASSIDNWVKESGKLLKPLYNHIKTRMKDKKYLQADETPVPVQDRNKKGKTHQGYFWVYHSPLDREIFFDYKKGRGREGPNAMLKEFSGWLQSDGYVVYDSFAKQKDIHVLHCMAHARRYFEKALKNDDEAKEIMTLIQKLYKIEAEARENKFTHEQRKQLRLKNTLPVLSEMKKWL
ncbi:MAG: IS66 family transposase, partial [Candidatus Marinimicrobia bacterium]|nr:IS66 family transposase [Candidatus Neomarinimicrobiota bacterium]